MLRQAIAIVANGTLRARNPAIWGSTTTACGSDSKHFGAWDQNLTTQWHVRYGGRGIMIYWHVMHQEKIKAQRELTRRFCLRIRSRKPRC